MRHSCGAILYAYDPNGDLGIILGMEGTHWLPFKGGSEGDETVEETAVREIYEETCGLVHITNISLDHVFNSRHKHYHIGLCEVPYDIIRQFPKKRKEATEKKFMEKQSVKFFPLTGLRDNKCIHSITRASIKFFWGQLMMLASNRQIDQTEGGRLRVQGLTQNRARNIFCDNTRVPDVFSYSKKNRLSFLKQPKKYGVNYTPAHEKIRDSTRVWRRSVPSREIISITSLN
jgi:ADP-ribose pyrophosphatase YjhB (NUDIX family)